MELAVRSWWGSVGNCFMFICLSVKIDVCSVWIWNVQVQIFSSPLLHLCDEVPSFPVVVRLEVLRIACMVSLLFVHHFQAETLYLIRSFTQTGSRASPIRAQSIGSVHRNGHTVKVPVLEGCSCGLWYGSNVSIKRHRKGL